MRTPSFSLEWVPGIRASISLQLDVRASSDARSAAPQIEQELGAKIDDIGVGDVLGRLLGSSDK
jgi:hypothetical protein